MARKGDKPCRRVYVPIVEADLDLVKQWQDELDESEAHVTRKLMRYAIGHGRAVLGLPPLADPPAAHEPADEPRLPPQPEALRVSSSE